MKKFIGLVAIVLFTSVFSIFGYKYLAQNDSNNSQFIKTQAVSNDISADSLQGHLVNVAHSNEQNNLIGNELPDFRKVVKNTKSAVVHVRNTRFVQRFQPYYFGYRQGQVYKQEGTGSGVIISPDGYIVTNNHVIKDANELEVSLDNNKTYKASLVGTDPNTDVAVIKIDANNLPYLPFGNSDDVALGEWVLAIGNPYNIGTTVTSGIVSAKGRDLKGNKRIDNFIQTDAVVNPGNSGGALLDTRGELIGINTMIFSMNGSYIGYSFAIPSNIVKKVVDDILEYGSIQKGVLGIKGAELNGEIAKKLNIDQTEGVYVYEIEPNTGAAKSGLDVGDIIIKLDNIKVATMSDLMGYLKTKRPGDKIKVVALRDSNAKGFEVVLSKNEAAYLKKLGLSVKNVNKDVLKSYGVKNGVYIDRINNRLLFEYGVKPGYLITRINNTPITSVDDITNVLQSLENQRYLLEVVSPDGRVEKYIFQ